MKRLLLSGLMFAALLAVSPAAQAGFRTGFHPGMQNFRREAVFAHRAHARFAGYRGWERGRYFGMRGRWIAPRRMYFRPYRRWW